MCEVFFERLWAFLGLLAAQRYIHYLEVGTTLSLEPDLSAVDQPVRSIRWKHGTSLVLDWAPDNLIYYGTFKGRTTLDPQTLQLDIHRLTMADSGQYTWEMYSDAYETFNVTVINPPPTPTITIQCNDSCALRCTADTKDLGPVTYEWKEDEGEWTEGCKVKNINSSDTTEKFSCRLITRVRTSEARMPINNPLHGSNTSLE